MPNATLQKQMYELSGPSVAQRLTMAALLFASIALAVWLLVGGGIAAVSARFGWNWATGSFVRRACLAAALSIFFVRLLFTVFVFLRRGISWTEVFTVVPWVLFLSVFLALSGGTNRAPLGAAGAVGAILFVLGSWTNSYAEYCRHRWKQRPENRGRLFTASLFRYSRHPNYLGDVISFSGLCLLTGRWFTCFVPIAMLAGFVFVNIPALDAHLRQHYGAAFDEYARRTRKLIPFVY